MNPSSQVSPNSYVGYRLIASGDWVYFSLLFIARLSGDSWDRNCRATHRVPTGEAPVLQM